LVEEWCYHKLKNVTNQSKLIKKPLHLTIDCYITRVWLGMCLMLTFFNIKIMKSAKSSGVWPNN